MRTYLTRHGNGYTPKQIENYNLQDESESNVYNGFQGDFKRVSTGIPQGIILFLGRKKTGRRVIFLFLLPV